jgi:hypothetical protein
VWLGVLPREDLKNFPAPFGLLPVPGATQAVEALAASVRGAPRK